MPKSDSHRVDDLLSSVTQDMFGDLPQALQGQRIHIERILLEMVLVGIRDRFVGGNDAYQ